MCKRSEDMYLRDTRPIRYRSKFTVQVGHETYADIIYVLALQRSLIILVGLMMTYFSYKNDEWSKIPHRELKILIMDRMICIEMAARCYVNPIPIRLCHVIYCQNDESYPCLVGIGLKV